MTDLIDDPDGRRPAGVSAKPVGQVGAEVAGAIEALLLMAVEPMGETELAQVIGVPETVVADALAELAAVLRRDRAWVRPAAGRWWLALLHPRGACRPDQPVRPRGPAVASSPRPRWRPWR